MCKNEQIFNISPIFYALQAMSANDEEGNDEEGIRTPSPPTQPTPLAWPTSSLLQGKAVQQLQDLAVQLPQSLTHKRH